MLRFATLLISYACFLKSCSVVAAIFSSFIIVLVFVVFRREVGAAIANTTEIIQAIYASIQSRKSNDGILLGLVMRSIEKSGSEVSLM